MSIDDDMAEVDINGVKTRANTSLLDDVNIGDWVIVHTGFAIQKYDEEEALETLRMLKEAAERADR
jgi:hydrogenase expression/formation protein HypC